MNSGEKMLKVFNTLSRSLESFIPLHDNEVGMYVCGPTVYGPGHVGHARTYIAFDIIRRYIEYKGLKVNKIVNITDIHDDMIKQANKQGITIFELAERNIKLFMEDMQKLGIKKATVYPRVTEHIKEIIEMVKVLEKKGFAYETDDGVYFDISKFENYGKLGRVKTTAQKTGTRVETDKYDKENAQDFAVWKKAKPDEPSWDSPWGKGRPGWHIECSVMSKKYLGEQFDIHGGAVDLIFPHHDNEIAQSEAATGKKPFVKYWLHTGFLNVGGEKMSKSLGNFITIPELLKKYNPKVFRFFIAQLHYRSRINFDENAMQKAEKNLEKLNNQIQNLMQIENKADESAELEKLISETRKKFVAAMDSDFNSPKAWAEIYSFQKDLNKMISEEMPGKKDAKKAVEFFRELDSVFNIFSFEKKSHEISEEEMELVNEREKMRSEKRWKEADELRDRLLKKGIVLDDSPEGTKWHRE
jgi:cysteinyl-tRNA synthetase